MAGARKLAVVAFGGNALLRPEDRGTQEEQIARAIGGNELRASPGTSDDELQPRAQLS